MVWRGSSCPILQRLMVLFKPSQNTSSSSFYTGVMEWSGTEIRNDCWRAPVDVSNLWKCMWEVGPYSKFTQDTTMKLPSLLNLGISNLSIGVTSSSRWTVPFEFQMMARSPTVASRSPAGDQAISSISPTSALAPNSTLSFLSIPVLTSLPPWFVISANRPP